MTADHVERLQERLDAPTTVRQVPQPYGAPQTDVVVDCGDLAAVLDELKQLRRRRQDAPEAARQYAWADSRGRYPQQTERDARLIAQMNPDRWVEKRVAHYGEWTLDAAPQQPEYDGGAT